MTKHCEDLRRVRNTSERHFLNWQHREREAGSPGREERVKSFPLQYKRKECAERLGFLLLQWELQKHREEAEEKKGGVSPLKTCRDWERKRERESGTENQRERGRTSLSVCLWKENISASQWFALGERHQLASDPKGRPDQVTPVKTKWALPLPLPPLSLYPGMSLSFFFLKVPVSEHLEEFGLKFVSVSTYCILAKLLGKGCMAPTSF